MKGIAVLVFGFALWLLFLVAFMAPRSARAGVFFLEPDGGWVEWFPDGGSRR